jgi:amino acid transporter
MPQKSSHIRLGQWAATAICGNDILSSSLYVSGIAILFAGVYAPLVLLFIGLVLFFYKSVYTEVVEALPVNGGAYNCLLNGTSKIVAAIAGIMTFLSYIATAVISAKTGLAYVNTIFGIPIIPLTIGLLAIFALLVISGIKDSAKVAIIIFFLHVTTLSSFAILGLVRTFQTGTSHFMSNLAQTGNIIHSRGGIILALYLAFSASLLGVSGFESSANFVEEQDAGVFRKTLRNMLVGVAIFNPLIALVVLNSMDFSAISGAKDFLLSDAAFQLGGHVFQWIVVTDAFLVLSGAVLTAYIGVSGLLSRMAFDGCIPSLFSRQNARGSYPTIVIAFFALCSSILISTGGNLLSLAGVYTIAFLGVMCLFAIGNLILRETRTELKRTYQAPLIFVIFAFFATFFGVLGNIRIDENNLRFFELYFVPALLVVFFIIYQDRFITGLLRVTRAIPPIYNYIDHHFSDIAKGQYVAFIHNANRTFSILEYINRNEVGRNITLIHCRSEHEKDAHKGGKEIEDIVDHLKKGGVFPHLGVSVKSMDKPFSPSVIDEVAKLQKVRKNRIFIGSIHENHPFDYGELGGVRIIF